MTIKMKTLMRVSPLKFIVLSFAAALLAGHLQAAVVVKIGTIVPLRSPWMDELRKMDVEWRRITKDEVSLKIYAGGIAGSEEDMVRKIRMGILGGAVFTNLGITNIYPDAFVLNIPFFIDSDKEMDYVMERMTPIFEKEIEKRGFKMILWSRAGWLNFFSKNPIIYPDDLKKHKLSFTTGAPEMEQAWKKSGFQVVPNELKDVMMGLQSGMITAFYLPPMMAAAGQYFGLAPHMCSLKIAPMVGGFLISKKIWDEIPDKYKSEMVAVAKKMADNLFQKTEELEKEAMTEMIKNGLIVNQTPPDAVAKWRAAADKGLGELIGKAFSKEIYDTLLKYIDEYRKLNEQKQPR